MAEPSPRHELFQAARTRADWSIQQLWIGSLALGGTSDAFDIEAFLHGLAPLSDAQQDVLASAVNERLDDLYLAARVPYLATIELPPCRCQNPLAVLDELLAAEPTEEHDEEPDQSPGPRPQRVPEDIARVLQEEARTLTDPLARRLHGDVAWRSWRAAWRSWR